MTAPTEADPPQAAELLAVLQRISRQLADLPAAIAAATVQHERPPLKRGDRQALAALLPTIALGQLDSVLFTAAEAVAHARKLPQVEPPLAGAVGPLDSSAAPRRLGKLLGRAEGHLVDGLRVARCGADRAGALWSVKRERV